MNDQAFLSFMKELNNDHDPDGYPAVKMSDINRLLDIIEKKAKKFVKPSVSEIHDYCIFRRNQVDHQRFFDHYESNGWMVGKTHMKNWQAAVRTWEKNSYGLQISSSRGESARDARNREAKIEEQRLLSGRAGFPTGRSDKPYPSHAIGSGSGHIQGEIIHDTTLENR